MVLYFIIVYLCIERAQDIALETLHVPLHPSLALASHNILINWCRHSHAFASRFLFKFRSRGFKIDVSEDFARAAPSKSSRMSLPFLQVLFSLVPLGICSIAFHRQILSQSKHNVQIYCRTMLLFFNVCPQIHSLGGKVLITNQRITQSEYLKSASDSIAFSPYGHLFDSRSGGAETVAAPMRSNSSLALSFSLCEPLQSLHRLGEVEPVCDSLHSFADGTLPSSPSSLQDGSEKAANAMLDLHKLGSSTTGLLVVQKHLRDIQQSIAILRDQNVVLSANAPKLLGFRSLTIVCGRGANSSTQGYSSMRLVVFEALVRLGIAPIARTNVNMLVGDNRTPGSAVDSVTIDTVDLWQWCVANADRPISLDWQRSPPTL
jgi:hypothetical protein